MNLNKYFQGEPDFTNDAGVKWWLNEKFTRQANPELKGYCWEVKFPDGDKELVFMKPNGSIIKSTTKPPTMHDWIKMNKLANEKG